MNSPRSIKRTTMRKRINMKAKPKYENRKTTYEYLLFRKDSTVVKSTCSEEEPGTPSGDGSTLFLEQKWMELHGCENHSLQTQSTEPVPFAPSEGKEKLSSDATGDNRSFKSVMTKLRCESLCDMDSFPFSVGSRGVEDNEQPPRATSGVFNVKAVDSRHIQSDKERLTNESFARGQPSRMPQTKTDITPVKGSPSRSSTSVSKRNGKIVNNCTILGENLAHEPLRKKCVDKQGRPASRELSSSLEWITELVSRNQQVTRREDKRGDHSYSSLNQRHQLTAGTEEVYPFEDQDNCASDQTSGSKRIKEAVCISSSSMLDVQFIERAGTKRKVLEGTTGKDKPHCCGSGAVKIHRKKSQGRQGAREHAQTVIGEKSSTNDFKVWNYFSHNFEDLSRSSQTSFNIVTELTESLLPRISKGDKQFQSMRHDKPHRVKRSGTVVSSSHGSFDLPSISQPEILGQWRDKGRAVLSSKGEFQQNSSTLDSIDESLLVSDCPSASQETTLTDKFLETCRTMNSGKSHCQGFYDSVFQILIKTLRKMENTKKLLCKQKSSIT